MSCVIKALFTKVKGRCRVTTREKAVLWDSELRTKGLPSPLSPWEPKKRVAFRTWKQRGCVGTHQVGTERLGGAHSSWGREICRESWGACPVSHLSPHSEAPSLAIPKGRSQREHFEAVSITQPLGGRKANDLRAEKIL